MKQKLFNPVILLILMIMGIYWKFFLLGKIPVPTDLLVGAYFPWLDYKWGFVVGVPVKNPLISDVFSQFFLWKYLAIDQIKSGIFPLWNPYSFAGNPLMSTYHSAVLNPFNILLFLPKYWGWGFYIFCQTLLAALGMYFFLGLFIKKSTARLIGSLVFSLSGLMTTWVEFGTGVWAASMLPWIFFFAEKFWQTSRYRFLLGFILAFVTLYLSGHAQLTQYSSVLFAAYFLVRIFSTGLSKLKIIWTFFAWLLVFGICSIQFLPTFDQTKDSIRQNDVPALGSNHDGLNNVSDLIRLVAPDFYGNPATYNFWGDGSYHEQASFLGVLTLTMLIPLLSKKHRSKQIWFWGVVLFICILFSYKNPLSNWFYSLEIPLLTYSNASRVFFVLSFAASILISFSYAFFEKEADFRKKVLLTTAGLLGFLIVLYITIFYFKSKEIMMNEFNVSLKNLVIPIGILVVQLFILAGLFTKFKKIVFIQLALVVFLVLTYFDLGRYFLKYNPFVSQNTIFPKTPVTDYLQNRPGQFRISRLNNDVLMPPNTWTAYKLESIEGYDPMVLLDYTRYFNLLNGKKYDSLNSRHIHLNEYPSRFIDSLNVKYLLTVTQDDKGVVPGDLLNPQIRQTGYKVVFKDKNTVILSNPDVKERIFFVDSLESLNLKSDLIAKVENKNFDPTKQAFILTDQQYKRSYHNLLDQQVKITDDQPGKIIFTTKTNSPQFAILSQAFVKDWRLYINNQKILLYEVNGGLTGFEVPTGINSFQAIYYPESFDVGWKISLISLLFLLISLPVFIYKKIF